MSLVCKLPFKTYRKQAPSTAGHFKTWTYQCERTDKFVEFIISRVLLSAPRATDDVEKHWAKSTLWEAPSSSFFPLFLRTPIYLNTQSGKEEGGCWQGREDRVEDKKEESGVQGGEMRGKRREKSPLNSYHCLDVNWSWSRFRWHRKQQVQSAQSKRGKGGWGAYWETEREDWDEKQQCV